MAEENNQQNAAPPAPAPGRSKDEVALELMKFIAQTTGYGKGGAGAGYGAPKAVKSPEEYADALLELFDKCRGVVKRGE
ncbi:MAG: hypothetical protein SGI92_23735 [Bryobacteraceae bacterium]|nr:hypothetical protein [Bryobacteraceae bacterium]